MNIGLSATRLRQAQAVVGAHLREIEDAWHRHFGAEVTNISAHGFWLLLGDEELTVPYTDFPWFKRATIEQILAVERPTESHLYWPQLDIDLSVDSLRKPDVFPLVSRADA